ncbi:MAG: hypothetical protein ABUL62_21420 [Myxococcales bacterium]
MKFEHKALTFALALAALIPACYVVSEKPADSAPPVGTAGAGGAAAAVATTTAPPLTTTTATTPEVAPRPPSLHAAKPLPTVTATGGAAGIVGSGGATP